MADRRVLAVAWLLASVACGGGSTPAGPSGGSGSGSGGGGASGSNRGTVIAVVDGVAYSGTVNAASNVNGNLNIASNNAALTVSVNFAAPAAVGTTTTGFLGSATVLNVITTNGSTVTGSWSASALGGTGSLTIASLTSTGVSGSFSFTAIPIPGAGGAGATGTKTVTGGTFTATF